jgi:hypothetical protein
MNFNETSANELIGLVYGHCCPLEITLGSG